MYKCEAKRDSFFILDTSGLNCPPYASKVSLATAGIYFY